MMNHPIIDLYRQQADNLLQQIVAQLAQHPRPELERALSQFKHSSEQLLDYVEKLQAVIATAPLLTSALEVALVLERILDTLIEITGAERAYIMLRDANNAEPYVVAARAWDQASLDESDVLFSKSIVDHVIQHRKAVIALNAQTDPRFEHISSVHSKALRSLLCVPLLQQDRLIGVLYADNRVTKGIFQETLIPLMEAFAHYAVLALENARRFQQTTADLRESRRQVRWLQIQAANQRLAEPLSERELEVLALIAAGQANPDIADSLGVGISTVKKHINHIYSKLAVDNRSQAILRAQALDLV